MIPIVRRVMIFDVCLPSLVHETYDFGKATEVVRISCVVGFGMTAETCKLGKVPLLVGYVETYLIDSGHAGCGVL